MEIEFRAFAAPDQATCARAASLCPTNPFYTAEFIDAQVELGFQPWLLGLFRSEEMLTACTAFLKSGRLNRSLEIVSLPPLTESELFWQGLLQFCRKNRVTELLANSYASDSANIPNLLGERARKARCEYVVDLQRPDLFESFSMSHRQRIRGAARAGLQVRRAQNPSACEEHVRLMLFSLARRSERGEEISSSPELRPAVAFTSSGAGELFQAMHGDRVVSSILILRAERGAYYQTSGTSPEGMKAGASHFLGHEIMKALRAESLELLNLGGADPSNAGLAGFKKHFGARQVHLESAEFYLGSALRREIGAFIRLLREDRSLLLRFRTGRLENFYVYTARANEIPVLDEIQDAVFRKLTDEELESLSGEEGELAEYRERFRRQQINEAYGVFSDAKLAHLSWFKTPEQERFSPVSYLQLRNGEAEITACYTDPLFRGRGFYPFAIRHLCKVARERNIALVHMVVAVANAASQRGIEKAGFVRRSRIVRYILPFRPSGTGLIYRGHRWGTGRPVQPRP